MQIKNVIIVLLALALLFAAVNCAGPDSKAQVSTGDELKGTITVSGAWALYPLMVRWGEEFQELHPRVKFDISAGGAGKGMADALSGAVDIGMVSREIYPEEIAQGAFWVSVTKDAVFLTVNAENPFWEDLRQRGIDQETLHGIYITGAITTWGQVLGRPEVTDPIHVFTRSDACGAASTWAAYLGGKQEDLLGIGVYGDPGVIEAVIKDPLGLGYNNLNFAFDMQTGQPVAGARIAPIDVNQDGQANSDEVYDAKEQAINAVAAGYYPSPPARDLNLVAHGQPTGLASAFIRWVLSDGQAYVGEVGYIPLPGDRLDEELQKLD